MSAAPRSPAQAAADRRFVVAWLLACVLLLQGLATAAAGALPGSSGSAWCLSAAGLAEADGKANAPRPEKCCNLCTLAAAVTLPPPAPAIVAPGVDHTASNAAVPAPPARRSLFAPYLLRVPPPAA